MFCFMMKISQKASNAARDIIAERVKRSENDPLEVPAMIYWRGDDEAHRVATALAAQLPGEFSLPQRVWGPLVSGDVIAWSATNSGATEIAVIVHRDEYYALFRGTARAFEAGVRGKDHSEPAKVLTAIIKSGDFKNIAVWSTRLPAYRGGPDEADHAYAVAESGKLSVYHRMKWAEERLIDTNMGALLIPKGPRKIVRRRKLAMAIMDERNDRYVRRSKPVTWVGAVKNDIKHGFV